jgi:hypothetical protein
MKNRLLAQLDRQIRLRGEPVTLSRFVGASPQSRVRATVRGIVKTFAAEQLIANITQTNYLVILSPTHLARKGWPGAQPATIPGGIVPLVDPMLPTANDKITFRGGEKAIVQANAIYDGDDCVRLELKVLG